MSQVVIENPIINSPFDEPTRHFRFSDEGITDEIGDGRRTSSYFVPIAKSKKKGSKQLQFDTEWTQDRIEENKLVNDIRRRVALWRKGGYVGVTTTTARLIAYWTDPNREKKLFFCQNEALETAIYIAEVAKKYGDAWIENAIREANDTSNPGLPRTAFKMATGSGKTVVMAMLIAWHTLNKRANPQDARFSDTFLIVTPGITIRDRLRVLLPNDRDNYYRQRDIVPTPLSDQLGQAKILITNYHAFQLRERVAAGKITKSILADGQPSPFTETPDQMVRRHRHRRSIDDRALAGEEIASWNRSAGRAGKPGFDGAGIAGQPPVGRYRRVAAHGFTPVRVGVRSRCRCLRRASFTSGNPRATASRITAETDTPAASASASSAAAVAGSTVTRN